MAIEYDFYKTHGALADKSSYHVRTVDHDTVDTETLTQHIQQGTTLSVPDLKGAISALTQEISRNLQDGRKVHIEGLGYFSLAIDGEVVRDKNNQLRLKNPRVRSIKFQAEEQMMKQMNNLSFTCQGHKGRQSKPQDMASLKEVTESLLKKKPVFTAYEFFAAAQVTKATGYRLLKQLKENHTIKNIGTPSNQLFTLISKTEES